MNNILIEIPTWLGDSVMATPAIENIVKTYPQVQITIFGSQVASTIFKSHPNVEKIIIDESKAPSSRFVGQFIWRFIWLYKTARKLEFDTIFSFRRRFSAKFFAFFIHSKHRYAYHRFTQNLQHQVLHYNDFINHSLNTKNTASVLKIYGDYSTTDKTTLGINPGASYGSAKRWYPQEFAKVAIALSDKYDIVIFGGQAEVDIAQDIVQILDDNGIKNYQNLAGKTTLDVLIVKIASLHLLITGDSGPMHVAAAFKVPTVAIFGPTKDDETCAWMNKTSSIVKKNLDCQPCMQRTCPLGHHNCMKLIKASDVLDATQKMLGQSDGKLYAQ